MRQTSAYKPKSKRRIMRTFKLDEISLVDKPAQAGAVATIMKSGNVYLPPPRGTTTIEKLSHDMAELDAKLDAVLKQTDLRAKQDTDLIGRTRGRQQGEGEVWMDGRKEGPEFEKEPTEDEYTAEGEEEEDEEMYRKARVHRPGRTAAQHEGDWYGAGTEGTERDHINNTRNDGHVNPDESTDGEMMPDRASAVLQPYAEGGHEDDDDGEEDEEEQVGKAADALATRLAKRFPRASMDALEKTVNGAVHSIVNTADMGMGREREYTKRITERQPRSVTYSDADLMKRLEKRFGSGAVARHFGVDE